MIETIPAPGATPPAARLPRGACDCHMHVFGPFDPFPLPAPSSYPLPAADRAVHRATLDRLGMDRAVLIQPSPYHSDNRALLDAIAASPERLRGVASCAEGTTAGQLQMLSESGVVGFRFVEMRAPGGGGRYPGTQGLETFDGVAEDMAAVGLHVQLWAEAEACAEAARRTARLNMPLVLDHLGGLNPGDVPGSRNFDRIVDALDSGLLWIKLTYLRRSAIPLGYADMRPVVEALVAARPDRMIWGSDWPFVRLGGREPDPGMLLDQLHDWIGEDAFTRILRDNPAHLFGFS